MKFDFKQTRKELYAAMDRLDSLEFINDLYCPGKFVYSQFCKSRIVVNNTKDLYAAKSSLERHFGCVFEKASKFTSSGDVIVVFSGNYVVPVELWIEAKPDNFPEELLGNCHLKQVTTEEYVITCDAE